MNIAQSHSKAKRSHPIWGILREQFGVISSVALFSGAINILALAGSFYMLQVYDRVLPSRSVPTLVGLTILMLMLYSVNGLLEYVRARLMTRVGTRFDLKFAPQIFKAIQILPLRSRGGGDGMQPLRDLDTVRSFLSGLGLTALFDLPWMPFYLIFVYLLHPSLAIVAVGGALLLIMLTALTEIMSSRPIKEAANTGGRRMALAEQARRNAEAIHVMGLTPHIGRIYTNLNARYLADQLRASDATGGIGNITRVFRLTLQSAVLGLGAYLVIENELSAGAIIAASITVSRSLAPIETAIANWKSFVAARQASARIAALLMAAGEEDGRVVELPPPRNSLQVEQLTIVPPGSTEAVLRNISFHVESGDGLAIIGPSGSGKSSLAKALVGVWRPATASGSVRIDGAALDQWRPELLGRHLGYMPQDIELLTGTVAENIARFNPDASDESIVEAGLASGAHDMILRLSDGYQTRIGEGGRALSGGERQRVALARAVFGKPFLVILDEPNANLDATGDAALATAVQSIRARGGIVIVIAHRPAALSAVNKVLVMANGQIRAFGPRDEVLKTVLQPISRSPANDTAERDSLHGSKSNA